MAPAATMASVRFSQSKTFQVCCFKLVDQAFVRKIIGIDPIIERKRGMQFTKLGFQFFAVGFTIDNLSRSKALNKFIDIVFSPLRSVELACADIEKRNANPLLTDVNRSKEVIVLLFKHIIIE